jgi:uncharacterized protein DUF6615
MAWTPAQHTLDQALMARSLWTAQQMERGYRFGIPPRETTITECNLLEIAAAMPRGELTTRFLDESTTGADWQWETPRGILVIQAKILDLGTLQYNHLAHRVGGGAYQVDLLLNQAAVLQQTPGANRPVRAFYVLYNSGPSDQHGNYDLSDCGCFAVPAADMRIQIMQNVNAVRTGDTSLTWAAIKPKAMEWRRLVFYL